MATVITDGITQSPSNKKYVVFVNDHYIDKIDPHGASLTVSSGLFIDQVFSGLDLHVSGEINGTFDAEVRNLNLNTITVSESILEYGYIHSYHSGLEATICKFNKDLTAGYLVASSISGLNNMYISGIAKYRGLSIVTTADGNFANIALEDEADSMTTHILSGIGNNPHRVTPAQVLGLSRCSGVLHGPLIVESGIPIDTIDVSELSQFQNGSVISFNQKHIHNIYSGRFTEFISPTYKHSFLSGISEMSKTIYDGEKNIEVVVGSGLNTRFTQVIKTECKGTPKQLDVTFKLEDKYELDFFLGDDKSSTWKKYNPQSTTWTTLASPAEDFEYPSTCSYYNGNVYVHDALDATPFNSLMLIYNVSGNSWTTVDLGTTAPTFSTNKHGVNGYYGGYIYVFEDINAWKYDISLQTLSNIAPPPTGYSIENGPCHYYNGNFYLIGIDAYVMPTVLAYNVTTNGWTSYSTELNTYLFRAAIGLDDNIYVFGTLDEAGTKYVTYVYNITNNSWIKRGTTTGTASGQQYRGGATYWSPEERCIHLIGGYYTTNQHWKYFIDTDTWANVTSSLPVAYQYPSCATRYVTYADKGAIGSIKFIDTANKTIIDNSFNSSDYPNVWKTVGYNRASGIDTGTWVAGNKMTIELSCLTNSGIESKFGDIRIRY